MMDRLTDAGILTDDPDVTLWDLVDLYGEPIGLTTESVVFADTHGYALNEWADALGMDRAKLSKRMHELARAVSDYDWSYTDPDVYDMETFDYYEQVALLCRMGCSPATALDYIATEKIGWSQSRWAEVRGASQQAVSGNVASARNSIED